MLTRMSMLRVWALLTASVVVLVAADPAWRSKPTAAWTEEDARQILGDSPWAKAVKAMISPLQTEVQRREGGNMGQEHGVGFDGLPDDRPRVQAPKSLVDIVKPETGAPARSQSITLHLRWESALPVRVAELKSHIVDWPSLPGEGYSLAVYGVPYPPLNGDPKILGDPLKKQAVLKREGKKDVRPSTVGVFERENGLVIVYLFPLTAEVTKNDRRIEFDAQIGRIAVAQSFDVGEMQFQGKLEL